MNPSKWKQGEKERKRRREYYESHEDVIVPSTCRWCGTVRVGSSDYCESCRRKLDPDMDKGCVAAQDVSEWLASGFGHRIVEFVRLSSSVQWDQPDNIREDILEHLSSDEHLNSDDN